MVYQQENMTHSSVILPPQQRSKSPGAKGREAGERILRTVYLPSPQTEPLSLKCEALQAQLQEQVRADNTLLTVV